MAKRKKQKSSSVKDAIFLGSAGGLMGAPLTASNWKRGAVGGASLFAGLGLRGTKKSEPNSKRKKRIGTALALVVPMSLVYKAVKPRATLSNIAKHMRSSGGANPKGGGYKYTGKFASFNKLASSVSQIIKKTSPLYKKMGADVELLAIAPSDRVADKVYTSITGAIRKLRGEEQLVRDMKVTRYNPQHPVNIGEVSDLSGLGGKGKRSVTQVHWPPKKKGVTTHYGDITQDPTAHGLEIATKAHRNNEAIVEDLRQLIHLGGKHVESSGGKLTGLVTLPSGKAGSGVRHYGGYGRGTVGGWFDGGTAGGHIHTDLPGSGVRRRLLKGKDHIKSEEDQILAGGFGSVLAHMTAPGSRGRALNRSSYGTKPIGRDSERKYPRQGVATRELRSAPSFAASPALAQATLDQTRLILQNPEAYEIARRYMSKNRGLTPRDLHTNAKKKIEVLKKVEEMNTKAGVTSDKALNEVFERAARNETFADEALDLMNAWK